MPIITAASISTAMPISIMSRTPFSWKLQEAGNRAWRSTTGWDRDETPSTWQVSDGTCGGSIQPREASRSPRSGPRNWGLKLHTVAVRDDEYDFGQSKFDLILFSWTKPLIPVQRVVDALKPGGIIVDGVRG